MASLLVAAACAGRSVGSSNEPGTTSGTGGRGSGAGASGGTGSGAVGATGGKGGFTSCFEAGSLVATPRGSVPIETLAAGDEVLAFDEKTGVIGVRRIRRTFVHETTRTGTLALGDGRALRVTPEHPVFVGATQRFERADSVVRGDELVTLPFTLAGAVSALSALPASMLAGSDGYSLRELDRPVTVYNLSVEDFETYFVDGVLVHNKSGGSSYAGQNFGGKGGSACEPELLEGVIEESCPRVAPCLDPLNPIDDFVTVNRPFSDAAGDGGASGESPMFQVGGGGEPGEEDEPLGFKSAELVRCDPDVPIPNDGAYFLAYEAFQPVGGSPTHVIQQSLGGCFGVVIGDVVLTDREAPRVGSWTTQCVQLTADEIYSRMLLSVGLGSEARLANPRFVDGCECPRHIKRYTTCGYDPGGIGGGSGCEPTP